MSSPEVPVQTSGLNLNKSELPKHVRAPGRPVALMLADDGVVPNNPALPMVLYREAVTSLTHGIRRA